VTRRAALSWHEYDGLVTCNRRIERQVLDKCFTKTFLAVRSWKEHGVWHDGVWHGKKPFNSVRLCQTRSTWRLVVTLQNTAIRLLIASFTQNSYYSDGFANTEVLWCRWLTRRSVIGWPSSITGLTDSVFLNLCVTIYSLSDIEKIAVSHLETRRAALSWHYRCPVRPSANQPKLFTPV
jgi:hypothetical protein